MALSIIVFSQKCSYFQKSVIYSVISYVLFSSGVPLNAQYTLKLCFCGLHFSFFFYIFYSFSWRFYPKWLTIAIYVRGRMPLEQLGVKCLAQGQIGVEPRSLTSKACVVSVPSPPIYGCHTIWLRWRLFTLLRWINHLSFLSVFWEE